MVVVGEWWWCGGVGWSVAAAAAAMVSARGERAEVWAGWLALAASASLGRHRQRLAGAERETASDNTREIELNRGYRHVAYLGE